MEGIYIPIFPPQVYQSPSPICSPSMQGFYSSVRPTVNTLMVNVNVCYTAFYKEQNLAAALNEFSDASYGGDPGRFVEGIRVQPTHVSIFFLIFLV